MDTVTYGVAAYSTLKWFADPILNTFSNYSEEYLAGLIFHELAHQQVYLSGQADFNEAYAETVQRAGVERWFQHKGDEEKAARARSMQSMKREFIDMAQETRSRLQELYASGRDTTEMRQQKQLLLESFQEELSRFRTRHRLTTGYDKWLKPDLNNALFASVSTYHDLGPAFDQLLLLKNGNMVAFHRAVARIAGLGEQERDKVLTYLANLSVAGRNPSASAAQQGE